MEKIKLPKTLIEYDKELGKRKEIVQMNSTQYDSWEADVPLGRNLQFITDKNLYKEMVKYFTKTFPSHSDVLNKKFNWNNYESVAIGSSPYIVTAVDMFLKSQKSKHRIATQRDLETNLKMFEGNYEDTGLVLKSVAEPNKSHAEYLYNQIKKSNPKIKFPIFVELRNLELDANLNFNLTPKSKYKTAECLNWKNGTHYSQTDDYGLPKTEDKSSRRQIWTRESGFIGLGRFYLLRNSFVNSNYWYLAVSDDDGRVVLVSAEGGAP